MKRLLLIACVSVFTSLPAAFAATTKDYQVTGPIIELTDAKIVVQKGDENWEIMRDADTKVTGVLKVGEKVTIKYKMQATSIVAKADAPKEAPAATTGATRKWPSKAAAQ